MKIRIFLENNKHNLLIIRLIYQQLVIRDALINKTAMKRIGMPTDAARLIGFLVSDEAEWITGQVIHSEGGFTR